MSSEKAEPPRRRSRRATATPAATTETGSVKTAQPWSAQHASAWIPSPGANDDKYRRGVLGVRTGSSRYPGAAVLGVSAAWRTGVGMLRYVPPIDDAAPVLGLPAPAAAVLADHPETVFGDGECDAWLIGSGTDDAERSDAEREALLEVLHGGLPTVVDAGALELVPAPPGAAPAIVTPHRGEFLRLWTAAGLGARPAGWPARGRAGRAPKPSALTTGALRLSERLGVTVLLKGSRTIAATPGGQAFITDPATPWLASAGTGDVLAGILGALVGAHASAIREDPELLGAIGATAAMLHDSAARLASGDTVLEGEPGGAPITASDVVAALPAAIAELRSLRATPKSRHR